MTRFDKVYIIMKAKAGSKRKTNESKEEADARRETDKYRARKRRGIETVVIVDFPDFCGVTDFGTLVPISAVERRCEKKCCSRYGIPLEVSKGASVHSLQGITVGKGKPIEKMIFSWNGKSETQWPSIGYVGFSRTEGLDCIALKNTLTKDDVTKIATTETS